MAYVSKETKANIVEAVKPILKKYGIKASFAVRHHSSIVVNIKSGVLDFIGNHNEVCAKKYEYTEHRQAENYLDVNIYWISEHYSGLVRNFLNEVMTAIKKAGEWFDESDAMTDYFHTAFYIDINVGKWDKPYELVKE
jgi:hypothetical protein